MSLSRKNFVKRLLTGSVALASCGSCASAIALIPSQRKGSIPEGNGCCKHKHCKYYNSKENKNNVLD